ncbi:nuclear transport factor 2 family protein [Alphaproteobacteria bacterium]|nr:nuclear transport factor 2 family protein [Alphaproteobacteria bacterium]
MNFQSQKKIVLDFYDALQNSDIEETSKVLSRYYLDDVLWRGFHPFNEINNLKNLTSEFWVPFRKSFTSFQRRIDIFLAGSNTIAGNEGVWVVSMGHLMGLFDKPWLGIKPTNKIAMLRYCEFSKIENGKISEVAMFFDIPHLMIQAGLKPFLKETGISLVQPGPLTHDGLMFLEQNMEEGIKTKEIIENMIKDVKTWKSTDRDSLIEELHRSWNEDMIWWGPTGIGATYTIDRYADQHAGPFRETFKDRHFNGHLCRVSEGMYGGFFGWPNLTLTPTKEFMGFNVTKKSCEMRVIDMYRRKGEKLTENWIFIDFLHFWKIQGIDILGNI